MYNRYVHGIKGYKLFQSDNNIVTFRTIRDGKLICKFRARRELSDDEMRKAFRKFMEEFNDICGD